MKFGIVIPWRETATRVRNFEAAYDYHKKLFPDVPFYKSDSVGERFNPAEARNRGCLRAFADGCDIVAVLDADTLFQKESIENAIQHVSIYGGVTYAYSTTAGADVYHTKAVLEDETYDPFLPKNISYSPIEYQHIGSGWVVSKEGFYKLQGWDENFVGWGYEDNAFDLAYKILHNEQMYRPGGHCLRLFHEERDIETLEDNRSRFELYESLSKEDLELLILDNLVHTKEKYV
jgi:predicted glycosyltransferase involved in capsule biosynthesis